MSVKVGFCPIFIIPKKDSPFISDFIKYTPLAGFILSESTTILAVGKPKFFPLPSPLITFPVKINSYPSRAFASLILPSKTKFLTFVELIEMLSFIKTQLQSP